MLSSKLSYFYRIRQSLRLILQRNSSKDISCGSGFCNTISVLRCNAKMNSSDGLITNCNESSKVEEPSKKDEDIPVVYGQIWTPRPVKDPPEDYEPYAFQNCNFQPPNSVSLKAFRKLGADESLGPDAGKSKDYKNPEYFAFHRYSFVELYVNTLDIRNNGPKKEPEMEEDGSDGGGSESIASKDDSIVDYFNECYIAPISHWETSSTKGRKK